MADTGSIAEVLLPDIKIYLNVTWQDDATDKKITGFINRGMKRLQKIAGASLDFTVEDQPRSLLLDYCRYANSQALEVFEKNFESELLDLNLSTQAPIVDALTLIIQPGSAIGNVRLTVSPGLGENHQYVYQVGAALTLPERMDTCAPPLLSLWDGISGIPAASGQDILMAEVNDEFGASRAGKVTVS